MAGRPEDRHNFKRGYLRPRWSLYQFRGWMVNRSVRIRCWFERGSLASASCRRLASFPRRPFQIWYVTHHNSNFHAVDRRRSQRLQRTLILISAIAKSSPFHFPGRFTDYNDPILVEHMEEDDPTLDAGGTKYKVSKHSLEPEKYPRNASYYNCRRCARLWALCVHNIYRSLGCDECLPFCRLYQHL